VQLHFVFFSSVFYVLQAHKAAVFEYNLTNYFLKGGFMKRSISLWQFFGFLFTSVIGTLLHFLYKWSGENALVALFSAINESTWEHMKILFFPMFIFAIIESRLFKEYDNFWCVKLKGILLGLLLIPVVFYTFNGVVGASPDFVNIAIFFITAAISYIYETKQFKKEPSHCNKAAALGTLLIIAFLFAIFTFITPTLNIFVSPI